MTEYLDRPVGWLHPRFAYDAYDELSFWGSRFGALLFDNLELRRNIRGLDVACGAGFPLFELAHVHGPSSRFIGIDTWAEALVRANAKRTVYNDRNVVLVNGNAQSMPFDSESFDLITSNLGINNFDDPPAAMRECHRVARDGARVVVTTNLTGHMAEFYAIFRNVIPDELRPKLDAQEAHRGTRATIEELITNAGFALTRVVESSFPLPFADGAALLRHPLVTFFLWGWRGVTEDRAIYARLEEKLNDASPLRMTVPMLYAEGVRR
ncbi:MAG TPA: class I SAM-dependent methyltransferase [Thermoanaerobaculia bacterium]|nr:class I SAM-dependent methyltransferase [Thermoanaerobaculia bacterium]